jgi:hypothetical protein
MHLFPHAEVCSRLCTLVTINYSCYGLSVDYFNMTIESESIEKTLRYSRVEFLGNWGAQ